MRIDVFHHTVREPGLDAISAKLDRLITQGESIMSQIDDVRVQMETKVQELTQVIADERVEVQTKLTALQVQIQALQDQVASGSVVTAEDLAALGTAINTAVDEAIAKVKAISEPAA